VLSRTWLALASFIRAWIEEQEDPRPALAHELLLPCLHKRFSLVEDASQYDDDGLMRDESLSLHVQAERRVQPIVLVLHSSMHLSAKAG
jgi:hypothetical protein